jgi:hypothetical protein
MRTMMIGLVGLTAMLSAAGWSKADAGVSVELSVGTPVLHGSYVISDYDDMDREDLIIIDNNQVGFWFMLPSGRWVFRCRSMWYDGGQDDWCYGPWWDNYSITFSYDFNNPFHFYHPYRGAWFHSYMHNNYPHYWERTYGHRAIQWHDRPDMHAGHPGFDGHGDRHVTSRPAPANHPTRIIETTRIITPDRTSSAARDNGLRKMDSRQPSLSAPANSRSRSMENNSRTVNRASSERTTMRRELGRR